MNPKFSASLTELNNAVAALQNEINAVVARPSNKAACRRVRTSSLALEKIAKEFRKVSVQAQ